MKTDMLFFAHRFVSSLAIGLLFFIVSCISHAQTQVAKITAEDGAPERFFGNPVAIYENTIVVGVSFEDSYGFGSGAAYIFRNKNGEWAQEAKLIGSGVDAYDFFGTSVDIEENVVIIGAPGDNECGTAYIFRFNGNDWAEEAILKPSDGLENDQFGSSVTIDNSGISVIGAPGDHYQQGCAYVFEYENDSWVEKAIMYDSEGGPAELFGCVVSINLDEGNICVSSKVNRLHIFMQDVSTWVRIAELKPVGGTALDDFGASLDMNNDLLVVGARKANDIFIDCGVVHIYRKEGNSWQWQTTITASDATEDQRFGNVAVSENIILVGATHDDDKGINAGAAYIFTFNGIKWREEVKILAEDGFAEDWFGSSVDLHERTAVIGAPYDNDQGSSSGAAYVFDLSAITGTIKLGGTIPQNYALEQNYPNPFNPSTTIEYSIPNKEKIIIDVFDILGRNISILVDEVKPAGTYKVNFLSSNLASGIYYYRMRAGDFIQTKKFILLR